MIGAVKNFTWSDKPHLSKYIFLSIVIVILVGVGYFRYRRKTTTAMVKVERSIPSHTSRDQSQWRQSAKHHLGVSRQEKPAVRSSNRQHIQGGGATTPRGSEHRILERPLFDGVTVSLIATLSQGVSTSQADNDTQNIEARITRIANNESYPHVDNSAIDGATISGRMSPNFDLQKINLQFSEFVTKDGRKLAVSGVALDPRTNSIGIPANHASGMGARVLGVTLGRAMQTADQIVSARILENTSDSDPIRDELTRQSVAVSQQPINDLTQEVTRDLRETRAVLSLDAGVSFVVRLKAISPQRSRQ